MICSKVCHTLVGCQGYVYQALFTELPRIHFVPCEIQSIHAHTSMQVLARFHTTFDTCKDDSSDILLQNRSRPAYSMQLVPEVQQIVTPSPEAEQNLTILSHLLCRGGVKWSLNLWGHATYPIPALSFSF